MRLKRMRIKLADSVLADKMLKEMETEISGGSDTAGDGNASGLPSGDFSQEEDKVFEFIYETPGGGGGVISVDGLEVGKTEILSWEVSVKEKV